MSKIDEWLEDDKLVLLEGWARSGLTIEQISENIGINRKTLWEWKNKEEKINQALKKGREVVDYIVENALLKKCVGYNVPVLKCFKVKQTIYNEDGKKIEEKEEIVERREEVHIPADTIAQIFWLKNRKKEEWKDKVEIPTNSNEINKVAELLDKIQEEANK